MTDVWRFPVLHVAMLAAFVAVAVLLELVSLVRSRTHTNAARAVLLSVAILGVALSPFAVQAIVDPELKRLASQGIYIHYGAAPYLAPAGAATMLFAVRRLVARRTRAMWSFWVAALLLAAVNLANRCSPGWCERFGFPFAFSWWSDAVLVLNGVHRSAGTSILALAADAAVAGMIATLVAILTGGRTGRVA